jgi:Zn-dependent protease
MIPSGDGYSWRPEGSPPPLSPASIHSAPSHGQQRRGGLVGGVLAALYGVFKYGFFLLKFGKLSGTFISFGLSLLIYIGLFGWQFGLGALLLIAIHESGHVLFARAQRLPVSAPFFLFGFGAVVTTRGFRDARQEAIVAIGGPVVGTAAALLCYLFALSLPEGQARYLFLALAYWGCLINLFNLIPMSPLDGGRVASALSKWANVAGIGVILLLIAGYSASGAPLNPFLVIILLFGIFSTVGRFRRARAGLDPPPLPSHVRLGIGLGYVAMLVISAVGMSAAHSTLLSHGIGQQIV